MHDPHFDSSSSSNDDGMAEQMLVPVPSYSWHNPQYDEISPLSSDGTFNNINALLNYNLDESSAMLALKVIQEHQNLGQFSTATVAAAKMILQHHMMTVNGGLMARQIPNAAESTTASVPTAASGPMRPCSGASISKEEVPINEVAGGPKQRVRARRGQATDPHSVAESLAANCYSYVLSDQTLPSSEDGPVGHNVAKLMEEDMRTAMEYLQANGVCVMPIKLATDISSATCNKLARINDDDDVDDDDEGPSCLSPCMSLSPIRPRLLGAPGSGGSDAPSTSCLL